MHIMIRQICSVILPAMLLFGCSGEMHEYCGADGDVNYQISVPLDSTSGIFDVAIVTDDPFPYAGHPSVHAHFHGTGANISKLESLDVTLLVDGKKIEPDLEKCDASYGTKYIELGKNECCLGLEKKLSADTTDTGDRSFNPEITILKKYKSLNGLPAQATVVLSAKTRMGTRDTSIVFNLKTSKDNRAPIRFH